MPLLFPDTTVLINFVLMDRVDLFAELVDGRGAWSYTVAHETDRLSASSGMQALQQFSGILGAPMVPSPTERIDASRLRTRLASPGDDTRQHQGEAETIAIMVSRQVIGAFVTDDLAAAALANSPAIRIKVYTTGDLIKLAVRVKKIDLDAAWDMIEILRSHQRARGMPATRQQLSQWVFGKL